MQELSKAEETFLITIHRLKDNAYGVAICEKINELTGRLYTYGTLYKILDQIVRRGYVTKVEGEPTKERGGRRKMFYNLTPNGILALKSSYTVQASLWEGIDGKTLEGDLSQ
ncbi:PadR family transcriptional regulator [candidate division KSB1 bacterium]